MGTALERYRNDFLTDDDLSLGSGMNARAIREIIKWGGARPIDGGPGRSRIRRWGRSSLQRLSVVGTLHDAGYPLRLAHTISFASWKLDGTLALFDPLYFEWNQMEDREGWWSAEKAEIRESQRDSFFHIVNNRWIFVDYIAGYNIYTDKTYSKVLRDGLSLLGAISEDRTKIQLRADLENYWQFLDKETREKHYKPKWSVSWSDKLDPQSLAWEYVPDIDEQAARQALANPVAKLSINFTMPLRVGVRRVLGLPVTYPAAVAGDVAV